MIQFGAFELDPRAAELRKHGRRIRLQGQPFQILLLLLEQHGKLVSRDEIRRKLWLGGTIVDFEHSISSAMRRLRNALGDTAARPRFIETSGRAGYRFVGDVRSSSPGVPSIALLPFANLSVDSEQDFFSDGLAEELLNSLTKIPSIKVIARTSSFAFRGKELDIRKIAEALGVTHVIEGSVRRHGNRIRVSAQLIAAADGCHLWADRFDRELADIFEIQDEIAGSIASALRVVFSARATASQNTTQFPGLQAAPESPALCE